jgi:serine/threonine-protein kinase
LPHSVGWQRILSRFELIRIIGIGCSTVYLVIEKPTRERCALKVIEVAEDNTEVRARFDRECRLAASLQHENLVRLFDFCSAGDVMYAAFELVDGSDLARLVRTLGPLDLANACAIGCQCAQALAYLHDQKIWHRDVKPSNLMISSDGTVKLLDLGIAKAPGRFTSLTGTRRGMGTAEFISPEQNRASAKIDHRADLYSLGATLFFLLTGDVPFGQHADADLPAGCSPDRVDSFRPELPVAVADVIAQLIAKDPADRVQSARALEKLLAPYAIGNNLITLLQTYRHAAQSRRQRPAS